MLKHSKYQCQEMTDCLLHCEKIVYCISKLLINSAIIAILKGIFILKGHFILKGNFLKGFLLVVFFVCFLLK